VWRTAAVGDFLARQGLDIAGLALVSGGFPSVKQPMSFWNAMNIPNRTATALYYKRLAPALMHDPQRTMEIVKAWVVSSYSPALAHPDALSQAQRDVIIRQLAAYTGVRPNQIDAKTLVMNTQNFLTGFFDGDKTRQLAEVDTRAFGEERQSPARHLYVSRYLRQELGYSTDLGYAGELGYATDLGYRALEAGYVPTPGPVRRSSGAQWTYNQTPDAATPMQPAASMGRWRICSTSIRLGRKTPWRWSRGFTCLSPLAASIRPTVATPRSIMSKAWRRTFPAVSL
jgi:hypothetical protein